MEKMNWLEKVTNEEVFRRVNKDRHILNFIWPRKHLRLCHVWHTMDFCRKLLKAEWEVKQQEGEEFKCYMMQQMMMTMVHLNGQLRTEGWRHRERISENCCTAEDYRLITIRSEMVSAHIWSKIHLICVAALPCEVRASAVLWNLALLHLYSCCGKMLMWHIIGFGLLL